MLLDTKLLKIKEFTNKDFIKQFASEYYKNADEKNKLENSEKEDDSFSENRAKEKDEPSSSIHKVNVDGE